MHIDIKLIDSACDCSDVDFRRKAVVVLWLFQILVKLFLVELAFQLITDPFQSVALQKLLHFIHFCFELTVFGLKFLYLLDDMVRIRLGFFVEIVLLP